jgi:hypothetical protein
MCQIPEMDIEPFFDVVAARTEQCNLGVAARTEQCNLSTSL